MTPMSSVMTHYTLVTHALKGEMKMDGASKKCTMKYCLLCALGSTRIEFVQAILLQITQYNDNLFGATSAPSASIHSCNWKYCFNKSPSENVAAYAFDELFQIWYYVFVSLLTPFILKEPSSFVFKGHTNVKIMKRKSLISLMERIFTVPFPTAILT